MFSPIQNRQNVQHPEHNRQAQQAPVLEGHGLIEVGGIAQEVGHGVVDWFAAGHGRRAVYEAEISTPSDILVQ